MPDNPTRPFQIDAAVLDLLACPVCLGGLRIDEDRLACLVCGRVYPIVDGIPVLIAERAAEPSQTVSSADSSTSVPTRRTE
jgi:uncharacterized protein YbaR (Trm112 family)